MNILFLTLAHIESIEKTHNLYSDLCREFVKRGETVYVVCPSKSGKTEFVRESSNSGILYVSTGEIEKTSLVKKGINTVLLGSRYKNAIKSCFDCKFDLILYSTPPITLVNIVKYIKKRDKAITYLMLKDIFPQNAVDLGMMSKHGIKSVIYKYFRHMETQLYNVSDFIGCMSPANVSYILEHNKEIPPEKVHVSPNSVEPMVRVLSLDEKRRIREKYNIPSDKKIFIYGGNLGKPQGVSFIVECIREARKIPEAFFVVCGTGTDYNILADFVNSEHPDNLLLLNGLPKEEYEELAAAGDVGLIFLDYRFTIPNFPSRLLSYLQNSLPVLAVTDENSDVGDTVSENAFGWKYLSNDIEEFCKGILRIIEREDLQSLGENGVFFLKNNYSVSKQVDTIYGFVGKEKTT